MSPTRPLVSLHQPTKKKGPSKSAKMPRRFRAVFRSFLIITPACKIPVRYDDYIYGGTRMTGTLFGYQKARINLAIHEQPRSLPILLLELAMPTEKLLKEMGLGLVRIALECEKRSSEKFSVLYEPIWSLYSNGRGSDGNGAAVRGINGSRRATGGESGRGLTYLRANFERIIGSKDSETFYMMNPDMKSRPELSIFFIRIG